MDRQKYDAPEPEEDTKSRAVVFVVLAAVVVGIMLLMATGTVQVY